MRIHITAHKFGSIGYSSTDPRINLTTENFPYIPRIGEKLGIFGWNYIKIEQVEYFIDLHNSSNSTIYIRGELQ